MARPTTGAVTAEWDNTAKVILRDRLKESGVTHAMLAQMMTAAGVPQSERTVSNKLSRGGFGAGFFLQVLALLGVRHLEL
jgi:hypothetical protein